MAEYEKLLDRAYAALPEKKYSGERFKPPEFDSFIEGNQTIIRNFDSVCATLRREPEHLAKYLTKELGAAINVKKGRTIVQGRFNDPILRERLTAYINLYVLCKECSKPDTKLKDIEEFKYIVCEACGARSPVPKL